MFARFPFLTSRLGREGQLGAAGLGWTLASQLLGIFLRLASNLILTRLLAPEAFGVLGTALAWLTTLEWLSDLGVQPAIMRHPRGHESDVLSSGWWLGLYRGWGLTAVALITAWPVSRFYQQPELYGVLLLLALRPGLMSLRSPGVPQLRRALNYKAIFIDELAMTLGGTFVSIVVAFYIPSVWAIVAGTLAGACTGIVTSYALSPILPRRRDPAICVELWSFGSQVMLNTLVMALWMNLDRLLGLRLLTEHDMGLYAVAWNLSAVIETLLNRGCDVHFAMLSRLDGNAARGFAHERIMRQISLWLVPLLALGVCLSPGIVWLLYDDRYAGAQPLFLILMCRVLVRGVGQAQFQLLLAENKIRYGTTAYLVALAVQAITIGPLTLRFGVQGLAASVLLSTTCVTVVQSLLTAGQAGFSPRPIYLSLAWVGVPLFSLLVQQFA